MHKKYKIYDGGYRPHFKFFGSKRDKLFFGCEIETEKHGENHVAEDSATEVLEKVNRHYNKFVYFKEDGSLDNGVEFVTQPFSWDWFNKNQEYLQKIVEEIRKGFKVKRTCGFHVHMSARYFTKSHLIKMREFFFENETLLFEVSQRTRDRFVEYANEARDDFSDDMLGYAYQIPSERNVLLNFCNVFPKQSGFTGTLEVRIFQGTLNYKLIRANLEFCMASVEFTRIGEVGELTSKKFRKFVRKYQNAYPNLFKALILKQKGMKWRK